MKMHKKMNFDVCTFCNHKCFFCSNQDPRTQKTTTSLKDFITTMDNVMRYVQTDEMGLSAKGEVALNKELEDIIVACKERYKIPYVYISSNGALMHKQRMQSLLEAGLDSVKFSINAVDSENYEKVHGKADFEKVIQNIKDLMQLKKEKYPNTKIFISSVLTNQNSKNPSHELAQMLGGGGNNSLIDGIWHYPRGWSPKDEDTFENPNRALKNGALCLKPFDEIWIDSDCSLGLCCVDFFDTTTFGSLLEHDFLELYNSKKFVDIRNMLQTRNVPKDHICSKCLGLNGESK